MPQALSLSSLAAALALAGCPAGSATRESSGADSGGARDSGEPGDTGESGDSSGLGDSGDTAAELQDADGDGSPDSDDCDDGDPYVYPGAPDTCHDGIDTNCDGVDASCDWTTGTHDFSEDGVVLYARGGEWGVVGACGGSDLDGDGVGDLVSRGWYYPDGGLVQVVLGGAPFPPVPDASYDYATLWSGTGGMEFGDPVYCAGDLDGDGLGELLTDDSSGTGVLWYNGLPEGTLVAEDVAVAWVQDGGIGVDRSSTPRDMTGDGVSDAVILATFGLARGAGVGFLAAGLRGDVGVGDLSAGVEVAGYTAIAAGGDLDGDGAPDLVVGDERGAGDSTGPMDGDVMVYLGPFDTFTAAEGYHARAEGDTDDLQLGCSVATGDVDGDGRDDVVAGACGLQTDADPLTSDGGAVVLLSPAEPAGDWPVWAKIEGESGERAGRCVSVLDASLGPGERAVVVGSNVQVADDYSSARLFAGLASGVQSTASATAQFVDQVFGGGDLTCGEVSDLSGDGVTDLMFASAINTENYLGGFLLSLGAGS